MSVRMAALFAVLSLPLLAKGGGHASGHSSGSHSSSHSSGGSHPVSHPAPHVEAPHVTPHPTPHVTETIHVTPTYRRPAVVVVHHYVYEPAPSRAFWYWWWFSRPHYQPIYVHTQTVAPSVANWNYEDSTEGFDWVKAGLWASGALVVVLVIVFILEYRKGPTP